MGEIFDKLERFNATLNSDTDQEILTLNDSRLLNWLGIDANSKGSMSEITYYTCMKLLSETLGKLPIKYYQDTDKGRIRAEPSDMSVKLTMEPNPYMTPSTLWTYTELARNHYGNGFIYIARKEVWIGGKVEYKVVGLYPMNPENTVVMFDNKGIFADEYGNKIWYQYTEPKKGELMLIPARDVIHVKTWLTHDGIIGKPVKEILQETVGGALESQTVANNMYKNGLTASMALQYTGDLDDKRVKQLQSKFADKLSGAKNAGKIVPIPIGLTLTPLNVSLSDAQYMDIRKYTALQIAAAFGIKPTQINDYTKSSYASSEAQQIDFLVNTMLYPLKVYEEEINRKVLEEQQKKDGYYFKFNEKVLLRTDSKTQADILNAQHLGGMITANEGRRELDRPDMDGGDKLIVNGSYIPLTMVGEQYTNKAEGGE